MMLCCACVCVVFSWVRSEEVKFICVCVMCGYISVYVIVYLSVCVA